jgi:hypothetical protein
MLPGKGQQFLVKIAEIEDERTGDHRRVVKRLRLHAPSRRAKTYAVTPRRAAPLLVPSRLRRPQLAA